VSSNWKSQQLGAHVLLRSYYKETLRAGWAIWGFLILLVGGIAFPASILYVQSSPEPLPPWWNPAPTLALLLLLVAFSVLSVVFLSFARLYIDVNSENIHVRFGIMRKRISLSTVVSCEPTTAKFRVYGGVGIRLGTDGSLAYTISTGSAVKINIENGRPFVVSTRNPEQLAKIINEVSRTQQPRVIS
jgi:hypothetical protein